MKLTFWGAAGTVTGSMHLVEVNGDRYLLDCGLNQGRRKDTDRKNRNLPVEGGSIGGVTSMIRKSGDRVSSSRCHGNPLAARTWELRYE